MDLVNHDIKDKVSELKFNNIKQGKFPYKINFPSVDNKGDLLEKIITDFQKEAEVKIFYPAIDDKEFIE